MHVPKIVQQVGLRAAFEVARQERVMHQHVEQVREVPVPMVQEQVVHVPKVVQQERQHHFHVEEPPKRYHTLQTRRLSGGFQVLTWFFRDCRALKHLKFDIRNAGDGGHPR